METNNVDFNRIEWKPHRRQALFLSLPITIKEALYGGGAGSGKTDVLLMYGLVHKWHENPRFKQVFLRRTLPEIKKEIVPRANDIFPKFGATYNKSDYLWTFPRIDQYGSGRLANDGAMIFFGHCEHETDVTKYDSMEISLFSPDEITSLTEYIYLYISQERNRAPKNSGLPSITRAAGMPGGIGHTFTKKRYIDPCKEGGKIIVGRGNVKRIFIHATLADNPHIDPTYSQSLDARPEAERKARKFGDWSAYQGQVFDEFRDRHYPDEPENALHVIEPFDIPEWWPRIVVGDWGYKAMTWIGFAAISPTKRIYLYRELVFVKTKIAMWAPILKDYIDREQPKLVKFCKSAGQDRGQEHTIQQQISNEIERDVELSVNSPGSRVAGKMLLHEYLRWKPKPDIPITERPIYDEGYAMRIYRMKGQEEYERYLSLFNPPIPENNLPKLQIFNTCPYVVEAIKACSYDKVKIEDVAEFEGDDPYDGIRYVVDSAEAYFTLAEDEFERIQKQEELMQKLSTTQDYTTFYRQMRATESDEIIKPVRRYH